MQNSRRRTASNGRGITPLKADLQAVASMKSSVCNGAANRRMTAAELIWTSVKTGQGLAASSQGPLEEGDVQIRVPQTTATAPIFDPRGGGPYGPNLRPRPHGCAGHDGFSARPCMGGRPRMDFPWLFPRLLACCVWVVARDEGERLLRRHTYLLKRCWQVVPRPWF